MPVETALDTCVSGSYANVIWKCNSLPTKELLFGKRLIAGGFNARKTR